MLAQRVETCGRMLAQHSRHGSRRAAFSPLPSRSTRGARLPSAFHAMAGAPPYRQAGHRHRQPQVPVPRTSGVALPADASYVVTGGLGGFGLQLARVDGGTRRRSPGAARTAGAADTRRDGAACASLERSARRCRSRPATSPTPRRSRASLAPHSRRTAARGRLPRRRGARRCADQEPRPRALPARPSAPRRSARGIFTSRRRTSRSITSCASRRWPRSWATRARPTTAQRTHSSTRSPIIAAARASPALTVNWGVIADVGMAADEDFYRQNLERNGLADHSLEPLPRAARPAHGDRTGCRPPSARSISNLAQVQPRRARRAAAGAADAGERRGPRPLARQTADRDRPARRLDSAATPQGQAQVALDTVRNIIAQVFRMDVATDRTRRGP